MFWVFVGLFLGGCFLGSLLVFDARDFSLRLLCARYAAFAVRSLVMFCYVMFLGGVGSVSLGVVLVACLFLPCLCLVSSPLVLV